MWGAGSDRLRMEGQAGASWDREQVSSCLLLDSGRKNLCSMMILSRLCLFKKAISCGYFFENGWKPPLYLVTQMLAKVNFIF